MLFANLLRRETSFFDGTEVGLGWGSWLMALGRTWSMRRWRASRTELGWSVSDGRDTRRTHACHVLVAEPRGAPHVCAPLPASRFPQPQPQPTGCTALVLQVGTLTSRLQADCQAMTKCMATNLNIAFRNMLQAVGECPLGPLRK